MQKIISVSKSPLASTANVMATTTPSAGGTPTANIRRTTTPPGTSLINPHNLAKVQTISTANLSPLQQQTLLQTINKQIRLQQTAAGGGGGGLQPNLIIKPQVFTSTATIQARPTIKATANVLHSVVSSAAGTPTTTTTTTAIMASSVNTVLTAMPTTMATAGVPAAMRTVPAGSSLIGKVIADQSGQIISLENLVQPKQMAVPALVTAHSTANQQSYVIPISLGGKSINKFQPLVVSQARLAQPPADSASKPITSLAVVGGLRTTATISPGTKTNAVARADIMKIGQAPGTAGIIQQASPRTSQLINAKVIGVPGNQRVKAATNIRMVNASNLNIANLANIANIANIDGKQVIFASKIQSPQQQVSGVGGAGGAAATAATSRPIVWRQQANTGMSPQAVVIGNQIVKLNTSSAGTTASRVVLTSTGQALKIHTPNIITTSPTTARASVSGISRANFWHEFHQYNLKIIFRPFRL